MSEHEHKWYALTVRYQHERQIERALQSKGLETLVPLYRSRRQWSDRVKDIELPLFAGWSHWPCGSKTGVRLGSGACGWGAAAAASG